VIFAELYWVPGAVEQAEARAHRIGTNHNKVVVEFLVVPNSPDERIYKSLDRKKQDTSKVLDGVSMTLEAVERERKRRPPASAATARKRPAPAPEEADGAAPAPEKATELARKRQCAPDAAWTAQGGPTAVETPSPVTRSKVEFLLRAAQGAAQKPLS